MSETIPLGEVVDVSAGQPAPKPTEFSELGEPFIRAGSVEGLLNGSTEDACEKIAEEVARKRRLKLYPKNTVVFAKSGMSAKIGRVYRLRRPAYVVSHLATLVPTGKYDPCFLTYWLQKNPPSRLINDDAYPSIRVSAIAGLEVPDLSLDEQRRIAVILEKADTIRRKREQALFLVNNLLKSTFLEMFGDPYLNCKNWSKTTLGEALYPIESGKSPRCDTRPAQTGEFGVLKVSSISSTSFERSENKAVLEGYKPDERHLIMKGDLLFSRKNTYELVGASAIVEDDVDRLAMPDLIFRLVPRKDFFVTEFLWSALVQPTTREAMRRLASGAAASMPNIGKARLSELELIKPPLELQQKFATAYRTISLAREQQLNQLNHSRALFSSLSQRAFRGEL